jgi:hypothetical protein
MFHLHLLSLSFLVFAANEDKIEIKQQDLDSPIQDLFYCGASKDSLLILTESKLVYRSESSGNTWKPVLPSSGSWKLKKFVFSRADARLVAFLGKDGTNWYSEDCGRTIKSLTYDSSMEDFQFHPKMRSWGLAGSWRRCLDPAETDCVKGRALYLTKDLGASWNMILPSVMQFSWGSQGLDDDVTRDFPQERVYVTRDTDPSTAKTGWNYEMEFIRSDDFFSTYEVIVPHGNKFLLANRYVLVATAIEGDKEEVQLMVAAAPEIEKFYKAELPVRRIPEHSYTLLDTSEGSIFMHVNHYGKRSDYGTIYISDASGRRFTTSLQQNVRGSKGYCDFLKVKGLEGIYIANTFDKDKLDLDESAEKKTKNSEKRFQQTKITFDKGGKWSLIEPPERDSLGKRISCEDCSLHLHSVTSAFSPTYTTENAVGMILATGNVGKYLSHNADELSTYLSRDGGVSWSEIRKGEFVYEMGDHGGILLMADSQQATDTLLYSWNEGLTWSTLKMDYAFEISNVLIEPTAASQKFIIHGEKEGKGVVVALDFTSFHEPNCRNLERPDAADSDYERWTPKTREKGCLMGRKIYYVRRKQEAECFNGMDFERPLVVENCECTEADFECDFGYSRADSSVCERMESVDVGLAECEEDGYMRQTTGYRRVAGDSCVGGVSDQYEPKIISCGKLGENFWYWIAGAGVMCAAVYVWRYYSEQLFKAVAGFTHDKISKKGFFSDFNKKGFFSDFNKKPDTMEEEELADTKFEKDVDDEEFNPRKV